MGVDPTGPRDPDTPAATGAAQGRPDLSADGAVDADVVDGAPAGGVDADAGAGSDASSAGAGADTAADAAAEDAAADRAAADRAAEAAADAAAAGLSPTDEAEIDLDAAAVEVEEDLDELAAVARQRDDYLDALRHLQADFENYKKRVAKQQAETLERAVAGLVDKLLPVLDTADLALAHGAGDGVKQIADALSDALDKEGLERIATAGAPFDPNLHDAVAHEPGDGAQEVAEVLRAGYLWKGRVIRPAMVKVRG